MAPIPKNTNAGGTKNPGIVSPMAGGPRLATLNA